jgi:hypothetical protein
MPKFKLDRKLTSSPKNITKMRMMIITSWADIWKVVCDRAQAAQSMHR